MHHGPNAPHKIPAQNLAGLQHAVEKIAKRAKRLKVAAPTINVLSSAHDVRVTRKVTNEDGRTRKVTTLYKLVQVFGEQVIVGGFEFIATLQHETAGTIVRQVATANVAEGELAGYRNAAPDCDHCGLARKRQDTFVVRDVETQALKQVGRTCLKDFFGHDPHEAARKAELLALLSDVVSLAEDDEFFSARGETVVTVASFVSFALRSITFYGWTSRTKARERGESGATADAAWRTIVSTGEQFHFDRNGVKHSLNPTEADRAEAEVILDKAETLLGAKGDARNDYEHNLFISIAGAVTNRSAGLVASVIGYVRREEEYAAKKASAPTVADRYVGEVGGRFDAVVTVLGTHTFEGMFGVTTIVRFATADNARMKWFGSGDLTRAWKVGETYAITFGVKKHEVEPEKFGGHKSTNVNRVTQHASVAAFESDTQHACPHCSAAVGVWCQDKKGRASKLHGKRVKLVKSGAANGKAA